MCMKTKTFFSLFLASLVVWPAAVGCGGNDDDLPGSIEDRPQATVPGDSIAKDSLPTDSVPSDSIPTDSIPGDSVPTDTIPLDTIPADLDTIPAIVPPVERLDTINSLTPEDPMSPTLVPGITFYATDGVSTFFFEVTSETTCQVMPDIYYSQRDYDDINVYENDVRIPSVVRYRGYWLNVTRIADRAFEKSKWMTSLSIPTTITELGNNLVPECKRLTRVTFTGQRRRINGSAFQWPGNGFRVRVEAVVPPAFEGELINTRTILEVPRGTLSAYKRSEMAKDFTEIVEYDF